MHSEVVNKILEDDGKERCLQLAGALRSVVECSLQQDFYEDLFLRKKVVPIVKAHAVQAAVDTLVKHGLLCQKKEAKHDSIASNVMVHCDPHILLPEPENRQFSLRALKGILLATDWPDIPPVNQPNDYMDDGREMVFPLHYESLLVLDHLDQHLAEGEAFDQVLDIFCGSGILGIYAAKLGCRSVTFSELYPRSLAFARLNVAMNDIPHAEFFPSDCFQGIPEDRRFDLILANPPFEAVSSRDKERYFYHSAGGEDGQELMRRFLSEKHRFLSPCGKSISVDFIISDAEAMNMSEQLRDSILKWVKDPQASCVVHVYDTLALREFWVRFDVLNVDESHEVLDRNLNQGNAYLSLCVLETVRAFAATEVRSESRPLQRPRVPWWNPMEWPLPCGLSLDPQEIECWVHHWQVHELEHHAEQLAARAESLVSADPQGQGVTFWDPTESLDKAQPDYESPQSKKIQEALFGLTKDTGAILLANVVACDSAELFILPEKSRHDGVVWSIQCPHLLSLQDELQKERASQPETDEGDIFLSVARKHVSRAALKQVQAYVETAYRDPSCVLVVFTIKNPMAKPGAQIRSLRELETFQHTLSDVFLIWNNRKYVLGTGSTALNPDAEDILRYSVDEVQRYVMCLRFSSASLQTLNQFESILRKAADASRWQAIVLVQLYRFLRDRLGFLAISALMSDFVRKRVRDVELLNVKERVFAFLSHNLGNIATDIPADASPGLVSQYMAAAIFTIEGARYFGARPLEKGYTWNCVELDCIKNQRIPDVLTAVCCRRAPEPEESFTLSVKDEPLVMNVRARVDPRFVAMLIELAMNLKKRRRVVSTGEIQIHREGKGYVRVEVVTSGIAENGFQYYNKLMAERRESLPKGDMQLRGVALLARLARELNTYLNVELSYVDAPLSLTEDPYIVEESMPGGWCIRLPQSMSSNKAIVSSYRPIWIAVTVARIPIEE